MKNITQKPRHKNTPIKQLVSITVARYAAANALERQAILSFFDWLIQTTKPGELRSFHLEVKSRFAEVK